MKVAFTIASLVVLAAVSTAGAAGPERPEGPSANFALPESPQQWINSPPLSLEQLKGKAVFLWFFEEECPRCRGKWPEMLQMARQHANDPIVFIAVNSGAPRGEIERYVKECRITWPVIVDPTRQLEADAGLTEISLSNITQARVVTSEGKLARGRWDDVEGTVSGALTGAAWKIDPKEIPAALRAAWNEIELGNYPLAAAGVKKGLVSQKADVKAGAEKLQEFVTKELDAELAAAAEALAAEQKFQAFQLYARIAERFKGFDLPDAVEKNRKALSNDPSIKEEIAALRQYDAAIRQLASPAQRKRGTAALEKLAKERPETEAGKKAQAALENAAKAG